MKNFMKRSEIMQLDFFSPVDVQILRDDFDKVKTSSENVRRGIFKRHDILEKKCEALQKELQEIKDLIYGKKEGQIFFDYSKTG